MVSFSHELLILYFPFMLFLIFLYRLRCNDASSVRKRLPPSPRKLPIIGNLHQLGLLPHKSLRSLSRNYGPLMLLHFGRVPVLVASSADAAREIMKNQDSIFANRPKLIFADKLFYGSKDVAFCPYGEYWRQMRSICVTQLLSTKRVQSFSRVREEETSMMIEQIKKLGSSNSVVNLTDILILLANDVVCRADLLCLLHIVYLLAYMGWKLLYTYDMFFAGTDTTYSALMWTMAELMRHPRTMEKLQNEVRGIAKEKQEITEDDLDKMHYLKAVIKESLRLHPTVPLLAPRESTEDTKIMGYDVAAGTRVFINAWGIAIDPLIWESPEEFNPERFLNTSIDFRGLHFELIPFGAGRRGCPGITFGVAVNELALAKLVYEFNFKLPGGEREEDLDMAEVYGLTIHKKYPLLVVATPYGG